MSNGSNALAESRARPAPLEIESETAPGADAESTDETLALFVFAADNELRVRCQTALRHEYWRDVRLIAVAVQTVVIMIQDSTFRAWIGAKPLIGRV